MKVLIIGSGGRENALALAISKSPLLTKLFAAPGNPGIADYAECHAIASSDFNALLTLVTENQIEMIVVGPEDPLVLGIYDFFAEHKIPVIGPSKSGAMLEGSKAWSKDFMMRHQIPCAESYTVDTDNLIHSLEKLSTWNAPYVLKASGLAAGKGVLILNDLEEAKSELRQMVDHAKFGLAGETVVVEKFLSGIEFSVFVITDGISYFMLPEAKDYKRIGEGDTGLNTGGMGAVSPLPIFTDDLKNKVIQKIIEPTLLGLQKENIIYKGFIYFGLMLCGDETYMIEYNCRLGDPETEVILPRLENDLLKLIVDLYAGTLSDNSPHFSKKYCTTVVLASGGYPGNFEKNLKIKLPETMNESTFLFHAGTKLDEQNTLRTQGGRVFMVSSLGDTLSLAVQNSLELAKKVEFDFKYYRKDIGYEFV